MIFVVSDSQDGGLSNIQRLRQKLLSGYDVMSRPVKLHTNMTTVYMTLRPFYLSELNEEKQIMVLDTWIWLTWIDEHLVWNPNEYEGVQYIPIGFNDIWKPDLTAYTSSPVKDLVPFGATDMIVYSNGTVKWASPSTIRNLCIVVYIDYPRDHQNCNIKFGSWTYHGWAVDLKYEEETVSLDDFSNSNPYWKTENITASIEELFYVNGTYRYVSLNYDVKLIRRPPIDQQLEWILSIGVVILTLAVFWLPPTSETKLTVGSINILVITALLMYLASHSTSVAILPYLGRLLNFSLYAVTSAIILEIFVINMAVLFGPCSPPERLYNILSGTIGRILLLDIAEPMTDKETKASPRSQWRTVATMTDRILFVIYLIVLLAIPKTG